MQMEKAKIFPCARVKPAMLAEGLTPSKSLSSCIAAQSRQFKKPILNISVMDN